MDDAKINPVGPGGATRVGPRAFGGLPAAEPILLPSAQPGPAEALGAVGRHYSVQRRIRRAINGLSYMLWSNADTLLLHALVTR